MTGTIGDASSEARGRIVPRQRPAGRAVTRGREAEQKIIHNLLRRAQQGAGGVVLVEGEPGSGRSRLLGDAIDQAADQGFSLAAGTADPLCEVIPFSSLRGALPEPFAGRTPDHPDADAGWITEIRAHLERRAAVAPVLVCLDDLHWASPATLAVLRGLPGALKRAPVAWLLTRSTTSQPAAGHLFRSTTPQPAGGHVSRSTTLQHAAGHLFRSTTSQDAAGHLFGLLERDGAARLTVSSLDQDAVLGMLADAFGAPPDAALADLAAGAAGNPALLAELIDGLHDEHAVRVAGGCAVLVSARLPQRVHRVAQRRLDGLSRQAWHLLVTAAALSPAFRLEDAAEMLGETPATLLPALQEAMDAAIISAAEHTFTFRHELLRRCVAEMIPRPARSALHRQYGELLLIRGESAVQAASHLLRSAHPGDPASLTGLDRAAAQTLVSAPQTAADLAARALELTSPDDPAALARAVAAAEALTAAGRLSQAARIIGDLLAKPLPPAAEARLRCALSSILSDCGQARDAADQAELVLAQPELTGDLKELAMIAHLQALTGLRDKLAGREADTVLAASGHDGHVTVAALVARAVFAWDDGQIRDALELLREAARQDRGVSPTPARCSRCSCLRPPLSTSGNSRKPTTSSAPPTGRRCTVSRPGRPCACCGPVFIWRPAGWPTPPPMARRP